MELYVMHSVKMTCAFVFYALFVHPFCCKASVILFWCTVYSTPYTIHRADAIVRCKHTITSWIDYSAEKYINDNPLVSFYHCIMNNSGALPCLHGAFYCVLAMFWDMFTISRDSSLRKHKNACLLSTIMECRRCRHHWCIANKTNVTHKWRSWFWPVHNN